MKTNPNYIKLENEECPRCESKRLFKCGTKRKCLEIYCGVEFESEHEFKAYAIEVDEY